MSEQRDSASQPQHSGASTASGVTQNPQHDAHQLRQSQVLPYPGFQQSGYAHVLAGSNSSNRPYGYPDSQYQGYVQQPQQSGGASAYANGASNASAASGSPQQQPAQHQPVQSQSQQPVQSQQLQQQQIQQQQAQQAQAQQAQLGYGNPYQSAYYMSTQPGQVQNQVQNQLQQPDYASYASYARNYGYVAPTNYPVTAYSGAGTSAASGLGSMNGALIGQQAQAQIQSQAGSGQFSSPAPSSMATIGQVQPAGLRPRITTTMWEDEKTLCYQVDANGVSVVRRADNNMINGTKLLNVARMTRGRRDGILKSEKIRHVVKIGSMHLKGVWIPFERALAMAQREKIVDLLYPLFVKDIKRVIQQGTPTNAIPSGSSAAAAPGSTGASAASQPAQPAQPSQPAAAQQPTQAVQQSSGAQPSQPAHQQVVQQQQMPLIQTGGYKQEPQSGVPQQGQPDSANSQQTNPYLHSYNQPAHYYYGGNYVYQQYPQTYAYSANSAPQPSSQAPKYGK